MISFAKEVKKELCDFGDKLKSCCGYSFLYGMLYTAKVENGIAYSKVLNEHVGEFFVCLCCRLSIKKHFNYAYDSKKIKINSSFLRFSNFQEIKSNILKCARCREMFLRGLFLVIGTVNDPNKSYRLDLSFDDEQKAFEIVTFLNSIGIEALFTKRKEKSILYLKRSEAIEDFFANIGATSLAFDIMNSKINKELINNANRVTNCDAANINKSIAASNKYISVINTLIETEKINMLPEHLKEMALKRVENKELSFLELGKLFSPAISKSGVYHRLEKILEIYDELING